MTLGEYYPPIEPYDSGLLDVGEGNRIYWETCGGFLPEEGLLAGVDRIRRIPAVIVNGRYDIKTPLNQAWDLHRAWPEAEFHIVEDAGHGGSEPGNRDRLIEATDRFAAR